MGIRSGYSWREPQTSSAPDDFFSAASCEQQLRRILKANTSRIERETELERLVGSGGPAAGDYGKEGWPAVAADQPNDAPERIIAYAAMVVAATAAVLRRR